MIVKVTEPEFRGRAFSLNQSSTQLATMMGPIIGGFLGGLIPIRFVFIINGIALLITAIMIRSKRSQLTAQPLKQQAAERQLATK